RPARGSAPSTGPSAISRRSSAASPRTETGSAWGSPPRSTPRSRRLRRPPRRLLSSRPPPPLPPLPAPARARHPISRRKLSLPEVSASSSRNRLPPTPTPDPLTRLSSFGDLQLSCFQPLRLLVRFGTCARSRSSSPRRRLPVGRVLDHLLEGGPVDPRDVRHAH